MKDIIENMANKKVILGIFLVIILIGIIMTFTIGLNIGLEYAETTRIIINIGEDFDKQDIRQITKEVFEGKTVLIQEVDTFKDSFAITAKEASEEQINSLLEKTNEKYGLENTMEDILITNIPAHRLRDIVKPYIFPTAITTILVLVYIMVMYRKKGLLKVVLTYICGLAAVGLLFLSVLTFTRIPVNTLTMPTALAIEIICILMLMYKIDRFENIVVSKKKERK